MNILAAALIRPAMIQWQSTNISSHPSSKPGEIRGFQFCSSISTATDHLIHTADTRHDAVIITKAKYGVVKKKVCKHRTLYGNIHFIQAHVKRSVVVINLFVMYLSLFLFPEKNREFLIFRNNNVVLLSDNY